ncbi:hypothetical protein HOLleu_25321 [Holothuria leucospilota]|uniref:Uncharacterized protein n=1 Tax=Holothuria leucospilota TaxID=206669 RepID=A0A9Q1H1S6_HOLLE|nr:hypothetical protein HOLleu_25321 [Holothuria leucospilota]
MQYCESFRGFHPWTPTGDPPLDPARGPNAGPWTPRVGTRASRSWCTFGSHEIFHLGPSPSKFLVPHLVIRLFNGIFMAEWHDTCIFCVTYLVN